MNSSKRILSTGTQYLLKNGVSGKSLTSIISNGYGGYIVPKRNFFTVLNQYERGVTFTLGKLTSVKEPGFRMLIPLLQTMEVVDMRTFSFPLEKQEIITRDNISLKVDAIVYYRVKDPERAVCQVSNHDQIIKELAQIKIRELLSQNTLDEVLHNRDKFSVEIFEGIKETAESWGVTVERISLKDIKFEEGMIRAMAKKAEAERLREAKIINAKSEAETSQQLLEAALTLEKSPLAIKLRELDTISQIAKEPSKSFIFIPTDMFSSLNSIINSKQQSNNNNNQQ
ncbi:hypothetical protein DLAC_07673 [Tieghemostelium lacteum]|uniref:Band 7 domain-containing protein n=1 Tax=Tieghemostelium lacteum TaxID=361077 RepID=A0A151ZD29_TIELA|nr:hypothetical protein DLAC_07673 [Tieghemostelium lacteum]|eukprot:KYQ91862.1 hypothetical protein DLAC_07673 [Tieghemostelium lacteum]